MPTSLRVKAQIFIAKSVRNEHILSNKGPGICRALFFAKQKKRLAQGEPWPASYMRGLSESVGSLVFQRNNRVGLRRSKGVSGDRCAGDKQRCRARRNEIKDT